MHVKKYKGKPYGAEFTAAEKKAMQIEINRQILEADKKYENDIDAMMLYTLHVHLKFGKKRLRKFWDAFKEVHDDLVAYYQMPDDGPWLARKLLEGIGVDVEAWNAERTKSNELKK